MSPLDYFIKYYIHCRLGPTYIITEVAIALCITIAFRNLNVRKGKDYLYFILDLAITFFVYLFLASFNHYFVELAGSTGFSFSRYYLVPMVAFLHVLYPQKNKLEMRCTAALAVTVFIEYMISVSGTIGGLVAFTQGNPGSIGVDVTFYLSTLVALLTTFLFRIFNPFRFHYVKQGPVILINVLFLTSYIIDLLFSIYFDADMTLVEGITLCLLLVMDMLAYIIFYLTVKEYNHVIDAQNKALKVESEEKQIEVSKAKSEELHQIRHDLKNQMTILESLVKEKRYDELESYFADINEKVHISINFSDTGNSLVDSVLNMEMSKAKSNGILLNPIVAVPKVIPVLHSQDLVSLLSNAIDNALEAEVRDGKRDPIDIVLRYQENNLLFEVRNSIDPKNREKALSLRSSKSNRMNHGYGTKILKSIVKSYSGSCSFTYEKGRFVFTSLLYLPEPKEENGKENAEVAK